MLRLFFPIEFLAGGHIGFKRFYCKQDADEWPYQPVIIKCLVEQKGVSSLTHIATVLAGLDRESIGYYRSKIRIYPKQVLSKHKIASMEKETVRLEVKLPTKKEEIDELIRLCDEKIKGYFASYIEDPGKPSGWGSLRVAMITETPWCHLCGAKPGKNTDIQLDIDHILPVSKKDSSDRSYLQVLCHRCNRAKGNSLIYSAAEAHSRALDVKVGCIFCSLSDDRVVDQSDYVVVIRDKYPVTEFHTLVIHRRHVADGSQLTDIEILETYKILRKITTGLKITDRLIEGFIIGYNVGEAAGQTVGHAHYHVIPRWVGDVIDPVGEIRGIIPAHKLY